MLVLPILWVRQSAGLTFDEEKSSKGNGTSTIEDLISGIEWFPVCRFVNIFLWLIQKIEGRISGNRFHP